MLLCDVQLASQPMSSAPHQCRSLGLRREAGNTQFCICAPGESSKLRRYHFARMMPPATYSCFDKRMSSLPYRCFNFQAIVEGPLEGDWLAYLVAKDTLEGKHLLPSLLEWQPTGNAFEDAFYSAYGL